MAVHDLHDLCGYGENYFRCFLPTYEFSVLFCHFQLDDEDSILPSKLQSALENVLERRRELANERGGDTPSGEDFNIL